MFLNKTDEMRSLGQVSLRELARPSAVERCSHTAISQAASRAWQRSDDSRVIYALFMFAFVLFCLFAFCVIYLVFVYFLFSPEGLLLFVCMFVCTVSGILKSIAVLLLFFFCRFFFLSTFAAGCAHCCYVHSYMTLSAGKHTCFMETCNVKPLLL